MEACRWGRVGERPASPLLEDGAAFGENLFRAIVRDGSVITDSAAQAKLQKRAAGTVIDRTPRGRGR